MELRVDCIGRYKSLKEMNGERQQGELMEGEENQLMDGCL